MMKVVTHNGDFHSDEVLAVATLSLHYGRDTLEIVRSRDKEVINSADIVVDVGSVYDPQALRFDHHQHEGAGVHENGIPYSSFGLVWETYGEKLCGSAAAARIVKEKLVYPIDAADNAISVFSQIYPSVFPYIFHSMIAALRPTWKEDELGMRTFDQGFFEALSIAESILRREIINAQHAQEGHARVAVAYEHASDKRILVLDGHYPWESVAYQYPEVLFVVKPDKQSKEIWKIKTVREHIHSFVSRKNLPERWAGKTGEALRTETGVSGAIYCHTLRYIATANSKESALALAQIAVDTPVEPTVEQSVQAPIPTTTPPHVY
ncbi:MAG: MYG1 family protein [Minisyncoccota bacterium]